MADCYYMGQNISQEGHMLHQKVCDDVIEFMGTNVLAIFNGLNNRNDQFNEFSSVGLEMSVINEKHWYPFNTLINAFNLMLDKKAENTLFSIGRHVLDFAKFPKIDSIEDALGLMDKIYHMNCTDKNGESYYNSKTDEMKDGIGNYRYIKVPGQNEAFMLCDDPFPCEFNRGLITKFAQSFDKNAKVIHDDQFGCKNKGGSACRYIIIW